MYVATLAATKGLKLLNLTELLEEENVLEFDSLDLAVHMLFLSPRIRLAAGMRRRPRGGYLMVKFRSLLEKDVAGIARVHRRACLIAYKFMNWSYSEHEVRTWYAGKFTEWDWGLVAEDNKRNRWLRSGRGPTPRPASLWNPAIRVKASVRAC